MIYLSEFIRLLLTGVLGNTLLRLYCIVLYPLAYVLQDKIRGLSEEKRYCLSHRWYFLWILLDDSIFISHQKDYAPQHKKFKNDFLSSWWWSAVRNSCVNYWNWTAVGRLREGYPKTAPYFRLGTHELNGVAEKRIRTKFYIGKIRFDIGWSDGSGRFEMKLR